MNYKRKLVNIRVAEKRRDYKAKAIDHKGGKCIRCGYNKCPDALEFHHRDPSQKELRISNGNTVSWETLKLELNKCDLLCAICHREVHYELRLVCIREKLQFLEEMKAARAVQVGMRAIEKLPTRKGFSVKPAKSKSEKSTSRYTKIVWPSIGQLKALITESTYIEVGKILGVSDNAVRKHCKKLGIAVPMLGLRPGSHLALKLRHK